MYTLNLLGIRLSCVFIAKARIHVRQQVYHPETMNILPRPRLLPPLHLKQ